MVCLSIGVLVGLLFCVGFSFLLTRDKRKWQSSDDHGDKTVRSPARGYDLVACKNDNTVIHLQGAPKPWLNGAKRFCLRHCLELLCLPLIVMMKVCSNFAIIPLSRNGSHLKPIIFMSPTWAMNIAWFQTRKRRGLHFPPMPHSQLETD